MPCACRRVRVAVLVFIGVALVAGLMETARAASHCNIDDTYHTAWSETMGWIDFKAEPVIVSLL